MTHAALADTYLDMKLHDDALFTAARAIEFDSPAATEVALAVIFDPRLIRRGAEQALRGLLFPG